MITLKYTKSKPAVYVSHIDLLRNMVRIIRRTGIEAEFSKGFNPHMLLFFSPPIALGLKSVCEYVTADVKNVTQGEFLAAFNKCAPEGILATAAFYGVKSPNLAAKIVAADYEFAVMNPDCAAEITDYFKNANEYYIEYTQKKEQIKKEVSRQIINVSEGGRGLIFTLATGNDNLRADRLLSALKRDFGIDTDINGITKIAQYVRSGDRLVGADEFLSES